MPGQSNSALVGHAPGVGWYQSRTARSSCNFFRDSLVSSDGLPRDCCFYLDRSKLNRVALAVKSLCPGKHIWILSEGAVNSDNQVQFVQDSIIGVKSQCLTGIIYSSQYHSSNVRITRDFRLRSFSAFHPSGHRFVGSDTWSYECIVKIGTGCRISD